MFVETVFTIFGVLVTLRFCSKTISCLKLLSLMPRTFVFSQRNFVSSKGTLGFRPVQQTNFKVINNICFVLRVLKYRTNSP